MTMTSTPRGGADPGSARHDEYKTRLATNIRRLRTERSWTQEDAARACSISTRIYQRCEAGTVNATLMTLARLASGLDVELCELFHADDRNDDES